MRNIEMMSHEPCPKGACDSAEGWWQWCHTPHPPGEHPGWRLWKHLTNVNTDQKWIIIVTMVTHRAPRGATSHLWVVMRQNPLDSEGGRLSPAATSSWESWRYRLSQEDLPLPGTQRQQRQLRQSDVCPWTSWWLKPRDAGGIEHCSCAS